MAARQTPRTDFGTALLHWLVMAALALAISTGLRIAADERELAWLGILDRILPTTELFFDHVVSGLVLIGVMVAYWVYISRTGLSQRMRLDRARIAGLRRPGPTRWASVNVILSWVLVAALGVLALTGCLLYLGAGSLAMRSHFWASWIVVGFPLLHVGVQGMIGGGAQLMRIFRPTPRMPAQRPRLADLVSEHLEHVCTSEVSIADQPQAAQPPLPPRSSRDSRLHAHPLATGLAAGLAATMLGGVVEHATRVTLVIAHITSAEAPSLDGDLADSAWSSAVPVSVTTHHGANLGGTGQSTVEIRAVHDGTYAYLAFVWDDPSRSLKHLPLVKINGRWFVAHEGYDRADENALHDDQFSVLLLDADVSMIGAAIHLARGSRAGLPASMSGRGLHYTAPGGLGDIWLWRAARGGLMGYMDNCHFTGPADPTEAQFAGRERYAGGFAPDQGTAMFADNFEARPPGGYTEPVQPRRLPKDIRAAQVAMGRLDPDMDHSVPEGSEWWLTASNSIPYSAAADAAIPDGTIIPGVVLNGPPGEGRAEIAAAARWSSGRWTLEVRRRLDTKRREDVPIRTGVLMWVAVFDHAQTRHTWHLRPMRLEVR